MSPLMDRSNAPRRYTVERAPRSPARSRNALMNLGISPLTMLFDHVTVQLLHPEILNDTRNHLNDYFPRPAAAALFTQTWYATIAHTHTGSFGGAWATFELHQDTISWM